MRKAFEAGLALATATPGQDLAGFYLACGDYLAFSMDRLHDQDQLIHDLLGERIPASEAGAHRDLATLNERQARSRALVAEFAGALVRLRRAGPEGVRAFEDHARQFAATFTSLLQPRKNPFFRHTDVLFSPVDWARIAGVTDMSLATEQRLFLAVQRTAPAGIDPEHYTAEHLPG